MLMLVQIRLGVLRAHRAAPCYKPDLLGSTEVPASHASQARALPARHDFSERKFPSDPPNSVVTDRLPCQVIPTIYRLIAMRSYTFSLTATGPGSMNGPTAKALFYTFHIAPEWIAGAMLLAVNVKDMFGVATIAH